MQRREFITLLGGAAVTGPLAAHAQQPAMPVIGFLHNASFETRREFVAALHRGLAETGYVEGRNVAIEYRWAEGQNDRLPALAADLVRRQVSVIVSTGGSNAALAAKAATTTIPIVFSVDYDPVEIGLVASLNRPGGNITGVSLLNTAVVAKRLELLHELVPAATSVAFFANPTQPALAQIETRELQVGAGVLGLRLLVFNASGQSDIDVSFVNLVQQRAGALLVSADAFFFSQRDKLNALAARHAVPAIYPFRESAAAGGLSSYGPSLSDAWRQVGVYTGRILKGEKPADLPVQQSAKIELVINLKTAKTLGLDVPSSVLARADEVIE